MKFRKHIRLKGYDYSVANYYFVTICTDFRRKMFVPRMCKKYGHELPVDVVARFTVPTKDVVARFTVPTNKSNVNVANKSNVNVATTDAVEEELLKLPKRFPNIENDFYVFMPDHLHWIIVINRVVAGLALHHIVGAFKSLTTKAVKATQALPLLQLKLKSGKGLWQPNFYEHIIRSETSLDQIRRYILNNPWIEYQEIPWKKLDPNV